MAPRTARQPEQSEFQALDRRVRRRLRKFVKRTPRMLTRVFCDCLGEALPEPQSLIFVAIAALFFVTVTIVLGGVLAVLQEAVFGGGPPSGLGLH